MSNNGITGGSRFAVVCPITRHKRATHSRSSWLRIDDEQPQIVHRGLFQAGDMEMQGVVKDRGSGERSGAACGIEWGVAGGRRWVVEN
ncbi:protein of unknown function [Kyrpidia spormannii]|uniref:Uncharacterized protein n=1 Tax=Kyrpidia spormannii TaxID=2055160 RepID=A0A6F9EI27_9BACL|nr:protein of unknown function [Kyrpidia spormannii]